MSLNILSGPYLTHSASWELFKLAGLFAFLCRTPEEEKPRAELNRGHRCWKQEVPFCSSQLRLFIQGRELVAVSPVRGETRPNPARGFGLNPPTELVKLVSAEFSIVQCRVCIVLLLLVVLDAQIGFLSVCIQTSAIRFGELGEVPTLLVVSDRRIYFLEITSEIQ